ncbi:hypothetical protein BDV25DRAFT_140633 [Aspergillus avenaceus]|uniref:Jacalin-type lectin domain-containing protein n=1 Tax=Aspergillus avenaceus TaxID=36643 RepID=A0A5N6TTB2_ASPAV|nr:hypothetical protein BDV25DRAFT_140633 [Aspergillus avenaceus]
MEAQPQYWEKHTKVDTQKITGPSDGSSLLVAKIEIWAFDDWEYGHIGGIEVTYHNGESSGVIGSKYHKSHALELKKGEVITSWIVNWAIEGKEWRLIHIKTSNGQELKAGVGSKHAADWFSGSGLLRGVDVDVWDDPTDSNEDRWAVVRPVFIDDVARITRNLEIAKMPSTDSIHLVGFDSAQTDNRGSDTEEIKTITREKTTTNSTEFTDSWTEEVSVTSSTSFKFLAVEETIDVGFTASHESMNGHSWAQEIKLTWQDQVTVPAHKWYQMDMTYYEANVSVNYDDYTVLTLKDGSKVEWKEGSTYADVVTSNISKITIYEVEDDGKKKTKLGERLGNTK